MRCHIGPLVTLRHPYIIGQKKQSWLKVWCSNDKVCKVHHQILKTLFRGCLRWSQTYGPFAPSRRIQKPKLLSAATNSLAHHVQLENRGKHAAFQGYSSVFYYTTLSVFFLYQLTICDLREMTPQFIFLRDRFQVGIVLVE